MTADDYQTHTDTRRGGPVWRSLCLIALLLIAAPVYGAADITFVATTADTSNATSYTFTNHAIGTEAADRCVVVAIHASIGTTALTVSSVTIGGNAASVVYQQDAENGISARLAAVATLLVTSGTTATIVVNLSGTALRSRIGVWTLTGTTDCTTLADSDFSEATDPSVALDVPANGSALGACTDTGTGTGSVWTGLTEDYDNTDEATGMYSTGASADFATIQTGLTMTCDSNSAGDSFEIGVFVSWAPAAAATTPARIIGGGVF